MDKVAFLKLADECLDRVKAWLEAFDPDDVDFNERYGALLLGQAQPLVQEIRRRAEAGSAFDELVPRADGLLRAAADRHRRAVGAP